MKEEAENERRKGNRWRGNEGEEEAKDERVEGREGPRRRRRR